MFPSRNHLVRIAAIGVLSVVLVCLWSTVHNARDFRWVLPIKGNEGKVGHKIYVPSNCTKSMLKSVQKLLFFVGDGATGSTLTGSLLDAHPHIIVSNEYAMFSKIRTSVKKLDLFTNIFQFSYKQAMNGRRAPVEIYGSRSLHVPGMWQGRILDHLEVIGDKKARRTTQRAMGQPQNFNDTIKHLRDDLKLNLKVLQVIRNPFDTMASTQYKRSKRIEQVRESIVAGVFRQFKKAQEIKLIVGEEHFHEVYTEDLIRHTKETLQKICNFLEIHCSDEYYQRCKDTLFESPHVTRNILPWPKQMKENITQRLRESQILSRYSFED